MIILVASLERQGEIPGLEQVVHDFLLPCDASAGGL
jgi:hypothetical protein